MYVCIRETSALGPRVVHPLLHAVYPLLDSLIELVKLLGLSKNELSCCSLR